MYELKKMERYLRVNLLGPGPRLMEKEVTGPRSHKIWETLIYINWRPNSYYRRCPHTFSVRVVLILMYLQHYYAPVFCVSKLPDFNFLANSSQITNF